MAYLTAQANSNNGGTIIATINALGNAFTTQHYLSVGISYYPVASGASSIISSLAEVYPSGTGGYNVTVTAQYVGYGTMTIYAYARAGNGLYYPAGEAQITVPTTGGGGTDPGGSRPSQFSWTFFKSSGQPFNLTAHEWNSFTNNINAVRSYKGLASYGFSTAYSGSPFRASHFNEAYFALQSMASVSGISTKAIGDAVRASDLNSLVNILNSVY